MYLQMFFTQLPKVISQIGTISVSHTILSLQHSGRIFFFFREKELIVPSSILIGINDAQAEFLHLSFILSD